MENNVQVSVWKWAKTSWSVIRHGELRQIVQLEYVIVYANISKVCFFLTSFPQTKLLYISKRFCIFFPAISCLLPHAKGKKILEKIPIEVARKYFIQFTVLTVIK